MRVAVLVFGCIAAVGIASACADDGPSPGDLPEPAPVDAASPLEASLGSDAPSPQQDAEPPAGDVCGDRTGLQAGATWPLLGGCPTRAGWSALPGPQNARARVLLELAGGESAPAVAADGTLWIGSPDGTIYAVASGGGFVMRARKTGGAIRSTAAINTLGQAIVGSMGGKLYAFDLNDSPVLDAGADAGAGEDAGLPYPLANIVFSVTLSGPAASSPVIAPDGTIYIATTDGKLSAYTATGTFKWTIATGDTFGSSPALGQNGTIYVGSTDRALHAVNPDGTSKWTLDLGAEIKASPAVGGDGSVYVGTTDGKLASATADGTLRWSYAAGGAITGTPAVYAGTVFVGSEDKKLHAVFTVNGSPRWQYTTLGTVRTPLIASGGEIYAGSSDGRIYAITPKGSLFFAVVARGPVTSAPALIAGGGLYVATENGVTVLGP